eukprot:CAMPEP_0170250820 /NCGR_PEP_ID=MMETSP0116_2-20130129/25232_1 /TAXON_ID=400756 /ORGANISM="Durinskia baltica, Strain CSIRO CS-38" /LENGTH=99 /DNA_ID=CAMNT_0010501767 /DNA_START=91 /DNA_END=387 /DNA_ORIENTATION=-
MSSPWDGICNFLQNQAANLQNILGGLGDHTSFSDIGTGDSLQLSSGVSPLHLFMFLMLAVWGYLYVNGRQREAAKSGGVRGGGDAGAPPPAGTDGGAGG